MKGGSGIVAKVERHSRDRKRGFTLDEMEAFVQEARRLNIPGDTIVKTWATWRQSSYKLYAEAEVDHREQGGTDVKRPTGDELPKANRTP